MQIISNDQTVRCNTVQGLGDFNSQSLATEAKRGEQLVSIMPAIKKAFDLMGDNIVKFFSRKRCFKKQNGFLR